ncbi:MAG TPA: hypothetical protein VMV19_19400 [Xanthobacteraceae bacterium]|nr:hypothetical protein [Xanthobacteraceae bacterium]
MADLFNQVLAQAVSDIAQHGFDSAERLTYWIKRLRQAAVASLIPEAILHARLSDMLRSLYRRNIDSGGLLERHPGIGRFTVDKVAPQLRAELDRRVMASANLIKLNRDRAIEQTLQRFSGWASSVPTGGSKAADKRETRTEIRKSLSQLPFEERRVLIDQGQKFTAALSETLALGGNAIAGIWHSRFRQAGYNYREDHKERDGNLYIVRGNWAMERGLMKLAGAQYMDEITKPGEEVFCRCSYQFVYALRDLPDAMRTKKGREALSAARIVSGAGARHDSAVHA